MTDRCEHCRHWAEIDQTKTEHVLDWERAGACTVELIPVVEEAGKIAERHRATCPTDTCGRFAPRQPAEE